MKDRGTKVLEGDSTVDTECVEHEKVINIVDGGKKFRTQNGVRRDVLLILGLAYVLYGSSKSNSDFMKLMNLLSLKRRSTFFSAM